jgi:hypothetical protein
MNMNEKLSGTGRCEQPSDEELLRRRHFALGAIAEITANLADRTNMPDSCRQELLESREQFHGELSRYWLQLTERGIS